MGILHANQAATLAPLYSAQWNAEHITDFSSRRVHVFDLIFSELALTWDFSWCSGGSDPVPILIDGHSRVMFNTAATTDQTSTMDAFQNGVASNVTNAVDHPALDFHLTVDTIHTTGNVAEFGFQDAAVSPFVANVGGAYFRIEDNKLYCVTGTGAAESAVQYGNVVTSSSYRVHLDGTYARFYVGDMFTPAVSIITNLPAGNLTPRFALRSKDNVDSTMYLSACALTTNTVVP